MYKKFTRIDELTRPDHHYITGDDTCIYYGEYTAKRGYSHSDTNQLIFNLKAPVNAPNRLYYKNESISKIARTLHNTISNTESITFIPVPPSKAKDDPLYDNRMILVLEEYKKLNPSVDYRELVSQASSTHSSHESEERHSPDDLKKNYRLDLTQAKGLRDTIVIFDDMLTAGSHFKAMQSIITKQFPDHRIIGLFVARRVFWAEDVSVAFDFGID